jgi:subtilisin family serine protease
MHFPSRTTRTAMLAAGAVLVLLTQTAATQVTPRSAGTASSGQAAGHGVATAGPVLGPATGSVSVTLVTGDRAIVTTDASGHVSAALLPGPDPDDDGYQTRTVGKDVYIIPAKAIPLITAGKLDEELFNVTGLIAQGYDDGHRATIPLIATYSPATVRSRSFAPQSISGATVQTTLPAADATAMTVDKQHADTFWKSLTAPTGAAKTRSVDPGGVSTITKVWLDRRMRADLAQSDAQIGAPLAWAAGLDGTGTTVAVLDTGWDDQHPDLKGQVIASQDFTDEGSAVDQFGHGTHVASTIAGTGAASGGTERGVAPGTKLLVGRVLDASGYGQESWIIAGMQWAVDQGADVASMSLGSDAPTDCTDPMGAAAQTLSASTTTLFVVAAGNSGTAESVGAPGCADGVLTVGAVDSTDTTADFSSRGPVLGSHHLKPDIAAPGVDILAAALGSPNGNPYVTMSGTSMATPQVAGAAAILTQEHPDWTAQQRKAAIMSSAHPGATDNVYAQGAGVVDIGRMIDETVTGPGSVNAGSFAWPHAHEAATTSAVTLTNTGDAADTFTLTLTDVDGQDGKALAKGTLTLGTKTVMVAAHGTATVNVTVHPSVGQPDAEYGQAGGRLVAADSAGATVVTPIGFWLEPKMVDVTVHTVDRRGEAPVYPSFVDFISLDAHNGERRQLQGQDETFRVRAGSYSIVAMIASNDTGTTGYDGLVASVAYMGNPEINIEHDTTLVYDARKTVLQKVIGPRPLEAEGILLQYARTFDGMAISGGLSPGATATAVYEARSDAVHDGTFELDTFYRMYAPLLRIDTTGGSALHPVYLERGAKFDGTGRATLVSAGGGSADELTAAGVAGKVALVHLPDVDGPGDGVYYAANVLDAAAAAGAVGVLFGANVSGRWQASANSISIPGLSITSTEEASLRAELAKHRTTVLTWAGVSASPYVYNLGFVDKGAVNPYPTRVVHDRDLATVTEQWYSMRADVVRVDFEAVSRPGFISVGIIGFQQPVDAPLTRTAYYTTGDTVWQHYAGSGGFFSEAIIDKPRTYAKGQTRTETWYKAPIRSGAYQRADGTFEHIGERQYNQIGASIDFWSDANPDHTSEPASFGDAADAELFANGVSLGDTGYPGGIWDVPAEDTSYALKMITSRFDPTGPFSNEWNMSYETDTTFRFHSSRPNGDDLVALPLLLPTYDLAVDLRNLAPATAGYQVRFGGVGERDYDAGAMTAGSASVSYDDGVTWHPVTVHPSGPGFVATVDNAAAGSGGYVSLRVDLTDANGNSVEQTIIRAYGVK